MGLVITVVVVGIAIMAIMVTTIIKAAIMFILVTIHNFSSASNFTPLALYPLD